MYCRITGYLIENNQVTYIVTWLEVVLENPKGFGKIVDGFRKVLIGFERFENPHGGLQNDVLPTEQDGEYARLHNKLTWTSQWCRFRFYLLSDSLRPFTRSKTNALRWTCAYSFILLICSTMSMPLSLFFLIIYRQSLNLVMLQVYKQFVDI